MSKQRAVTVPLTPPKGEYSTKCIQQPYVTWVLLSPNNVFFSDPWCGQIEYSAKNFSYDARSLQLSRQPDFKYAIRGHAFIFFERKVWQFGGYNKIVARHVPHSNEANVLSIGAEEWSQVNSLPLDIEKIATAVLQRKFYL